MRREMTSEERIALRVLKRTKEGCGEAFRLISSDTARTEGFFRRGKPMIEVLPALKRHVDSATWTDDGVGMISSPSRIVLLHRSFSVIANLRYSGRCLDFATEILRIYASGMVFDEQRVRKYGFELERIGGGRYLVLNAKFSAMEMGYREAMWLPLLGRGKELIDHIKVNGGQNPRLISDVYAALVRLYPENNYEMARIALNLLAEFEGMLELAIKHLERE